MINGIIASLNELAELLEEVDALIDQLESVPAPANIMEIEHEYIFDTLYNNESSFDADSNMSTLSMLPVRAYFGTSPERATNIRLYPKTGALDATIRYGIAP